MKIDKNIPIPSTRGSRTSGIRDAARRMNIGDSVVLDSLEAASSFRASINPIGMKVTIRKLEDGKYRAWRIK